MRTVGAVLIILVALILPAHADVVSTSAGDPVKGTPPGAAAPGRGVAGYVIMTTLFTAGGPGLASNKDRTPSITSYSFSDGVQTLTEATSTTSLAMVVDTADLPGDDGVPVHWAFTISTATDQISSSFLDWLSGLGFGEHSGCLGCLRSGPNIGAGSAGLGSLAAHAPPEFGGHCRTGGRHLDRPGVHDGRARARVEGLDRGRHDGARAHAARGPRPARGSVVAAHARPDAAREGQLLVRVRAFG